MVNAMATDNKLTTTSDERTETELVGTISRLNCQKPNFCAGRIRADGRDVSFSVKSYCKLGDAVTLKGAWEKHPQWGWQFRGDALMLALPTDPEGLKKWLDHNVRTVGPVKAARLVAKFGVALMDKCITDPREVADYGPLPVEEVEAMAKAWRNESGRINALSWFLARGFTNTQADKVLEVLGTGGVSLVQEDPYYLIGRVEGMGWLTVDMLAAKMGITGSDPRRLCGALASVVRDAYAKGSTCLPVNSALNLAADLVAARGPQVMGDALAASLERKDLVLFDDDKHLATPWALRCEEFIYERLSQACQPNIFGSTEDQAYATEFPDQWAERYRTMSGITFDDLQMDAVENALRYRISVLTGGAGSGKSSISLAITKAFSDLGIRVELTAPTGKAARRMTEIIGRPAQTMHRLLAYNGGTGQFERNELDPLTNCLILVDEISMTDSEMLYRLFRAAGRGCVIVLVGDPNQLPPVGAGAPLRDILTHDLAPTVRLEKVHRQAGALKTNSVGVLAGRVADTEPTPVGEGVAPAPSPWVVSAKLDSPAKLAEVVEQLYSLYLPKWYDPVTKTQFMTAQHAGGYGTKRMNLILQRLHQWSKFGVELPPVPDNPSDDRLPILDGDKVIQTKNDYKLNVMNGETGTVIAVNVTRSQLLEQFGVAPKPGDRHLLGPILTGSAVGSERTSICPVCLANVPLTEPGGWVPYRCPECGTDCVAHDGRTAEPVGSDEDDEVPDDISPSRFKVYKKEPVAEYIVRFPDRTIAFPPGTGGRLELAYCLSVHKMQGSQVECVVVVVPKAHSFSQNRSWLYTAVTRAQKTCIILGDVDGIFRAAEKVVVDERFTCLAVLAQKGRGGE